ncbi:MAG: isoleucine--tRNA ligase [Verrucomicrobia bacterium]|nr:isoleucine--tRNA ligase [Verrucomicrobiota bacterium]MBU1857592.1 isoleucine--tRNA ligase [Verrucomicrobiota bacterium]
MYPPVSSSVKFPEIEREILAHWKQSRIFEQSLQGAQREMVFYDGPPFPTGAPHFGTIFVSILKDALARYFTMAGYSVPRRWGWDCHGLPIENAVEKKLGISDKTQIDKQLGVAAFNDECRKLVADCNVAWESYINKIGRWVDYAHAYRTLDLPYMESVLWVFKQCYDKGLIYKDYRVTPYCYHCETSLSFSDIRESDSTRPRQDPEVIVRFRALDEVAGKPTWYLAWTTTPWTLTSNLVLAVGADFSYAAVEHEGAVYIMAEALVPKWAKLFGGKPRIVKTFVGSELVARRYEPIFPYYRDLATEGYFRILAADFVTLDDGVGVVHCAPAFGEDDYWLCKRNGLGVRNPVDSKGCFTGKIPEFAGQNVHEANKGVIRALKANGALMHHSTIEHNYPHCWRCRTPLIYRAMDAWYFAVDKIKDRLLKHNEEINWVPEHVKHGRFGKWLEGARDWNISRSRYWGTPIPVWECATIGCGQRRVLGSLAEIRDAAGAADAAGRDLKDLHKEFLDEVVLKCPACGNPMRRVPEVLDCWFESGAMPFGQCHYPFENKDWFERHFPADFIVEYPGQIRGWFYYLHVLAVALLDRAAFKNCLVHGTLLAEDGGKISKSKKNFTDPMELIDRYGADALRLYLLGSSAVVMEDLNFKNAGVHDQIKQVLLPLWNAFSFFVTYANVDQYAGDPARRPESTHALDQWILAKLYRAEQEVAQAFKTFYLNRSLTPVTAFIEDLTNWYIRQSRARFWGGGLSTDKRQAYDTLYYALVTLLKMLAPSAPFVADYLYRQLTGEDSVHLAAWPDVPAKYRNDALIEETGVAQTIVSLGLALRQKAGLRVRQPLPGIQVALPSSVDSGVVARQMDIIRNELNVKTVTLLDDPGAVATLRATPNARVLGPKWGRAVQAIIKAAKAGQVREEGEKIVVFEGPQEWTVDRQDIDLSYQGKDGMDVLGDKGILLALDKTLTPALREEGIANELNRIIQDLRKTAGYAVSDRIELTIEGELGSAWRGHLLQLALAEAVDLSEAQADATTRETIEGRAFRVSIRKIQP